MNVASADRNLTISPGTRKRVSTFRGIYLRLSGWVFCSSPKKSFLSLPENCSHESRSRIFCAQRRTRVKFINKIDSEVAWMTRVLDERFSPCCLPANLFYVLVNVLNKGAHYLSELTRSVTCFFFFKMRVTLHSSHDLLQILPYKTKRSATREGKIVLVKRCLCITDAVKIYYLSHNNNLFLVHSNFFFFFFFCESFGREVAEFGYSHIKLY